jgi:septum formation protein
MVTDERREIILASGSPRRRELLSQLGFKPRVVVSQVPEEPQPDEGGAAYTRRLAQAKAAAVAAMLADEPSGEQTPAWVLAADTVVTLDGAILEKPLDEADARRMLRELSGREHEVITSGCWRHRVDGRERVFTSVARVTMCELDEETIARYVETGEPMDKAGGYGIQGVAGALVEQMSGSYTCVVGLPIAQVVATLKELGGLAGFPFRGR